MLGEVIVAIVVRLIIIVLFISLTDYLYVVLDSWKSRSEK